MNPYPALAFPGQSAYLHNERAGRRYLPFLPNLPILLFCLLVSGSGCSRAFFVDLMVPSLGESAKAGYKLTDPEFMRYALPGSLLTLQGLMEISPENPELLLLIAQGKCGYAWAFIEEEDPRRASHYYEEGRDLALKALALKSSRVKESLQEKKALNAITGELSDGALVPYLFWLGNCWGSYLNLNLNSPRVVLSAPQVLALMSRVLDLDPSYYHGGAYMFFAAYYAAIPELAGGGLRKAHPYFEKAFEISRRKFLLVHYYFLKNYALLLKDGEDPVTGKKGLELFDEVAKEVRRADPRALPDVAFVNAVVQKKLEGLEELRRELGDL